MTETPSTRPGLVRGLGPLMATAVVVGIVIGSGIFKKPQMVAENLPDYTMIAAVWIVGGLLTFLGALTLAEVAVLFPQAGGNYVYLREGFGPLAAFLWGWVEFLVIKAAALAALATIFTEQFHDILKESMGATLTYWQEKGLSATVIIFLALVNVRGVRWGGGLQLAITFVKVGSLLAIMLLPWIMMATGQAASSPGPHEATGHADITLSRFLIALLGVLWSYHGWMGIAPVAGEIREPQRNIPLSLLAGCLIVIVVYLGANLAYHWVLPLSEIAHMKSPSVATVFSTRLLGSVGGVITSAAIMISVFGALNGNLLSGPRLLYAMGEDRMVPRTLAAVHPRYHTPAWAIAVLAAWSVALLLIVALLTWIGALEADKDHFDILTNFSMFGAIIFETLGVATIFVFRWKLPDAPRAYRCWGYPIVPALYLVLPALVIGNMFVNQRLEAVTGAGFIAVGTIVYFAVVKRGRTPMSPQR